MKRLFAALLLTISTLAFADNPVARGPAIAVASGAYTPFYDGIENMAGGVPLELQYVRVGNMVIVSGAVQFYPVAGQTTTRVCVALPIHTVFMSSERLGGSGVVEFLLSPVAITGRQDCAEFAFFAENIAVQKITFTFAYRL